MFIKKEAFERLTKNLREAEFKVAQYEYDLKRQCASVTLWTLDENGNREHLEFDDVGQHAWGDDNRYNLYDRHCRLVASIANIEDIIITYAESRCDCGESGCCEAK